MKKTAVLIVDDEKNIRLTLSQALEPLELEVGTAVNGEEALGKTEDGSFGLVLLDLKMPGMDGLDVLQRLAKERPDLRVIIITAHGTIESAVDAMKLGAVDFIQKPFAPDEIRELVTRVLKRDELDEEKAEDYESRIELAKRSMTSRLYDAAVEHLRKATILEPKRPEAYNLLGVVHEIRGEKSEALEQYRVALVHDPAYKPADANLHRAVTWSESRKPGGYDLGDGAKRARGKGKA